MMNKYYTPKIEEFHVGFEYEEKSSGLWTKRNYDDLSPILNKYLVDDYGVKYDTIEDYIREDVVRVKYLDQEDIESFGFKFEEEDSDFITFRKYNEEHYYWEIHVFKKNIWKGIYIRETNLHNTGWEDPKFEGNIKNKSELKQILKMIGVLEDE